jgi:hypothetical protein
MARGRRCGQDHATRFTADEAALRPEYNSWHSKGGRIEMAEIGAVRVVHSTHDNQHVLTFYEDGALLGSMAVSSSQNGFPSEMSLDETRRMLPTRGQLWWDRVGVEIRGGAARMYFRSRHQRPDCPEPDVPRIVSLIWGTPLLVHEDKRPTDDECRRRTEDIEAWVDDFYRARSARL